jgi:hypothetical protein
MYLTDHCRLAIVVAAQQYLFNDRWPGLESFNSYFLGVFITGWNLATIIFFSTIWVEMPEYRWEHNVFIFLNVFASVVYLILFFTDTGTMSPNDASKTLRVCDISLSLSLSPSLPPSTYSLPRLCLSGILIDETGSNSTDRAWRLYSILLPNMHGMIDQLRFNCNGLRDN